MAHNTYPRLHNAMWPGLVGKGAGRRAADRPRHDARPHRRGRGRRRRSSTASISSSSIRTSSIDATTTTLKRLADKVAGYGPRGRLGRRAGLAAAPAAARRWASAEERERFVDAGAQGLPRSASKLRELGVRPYGVVRIDSAAERRRTGRKDPEGNTQADRRDVPRGVRRRGGSRRAPGRRGRNLLGRHALLARHASSCSRWSDRPKTLGFQADMAHTLLFTLGYNAPEDRILPEGLRLEGPARARRGAARR